MTEWNEKKREGVEWLKKTEKHAFTRITNQKQRTNYIWHSVFCVNLNGNGKSVRAQERGHTKSTKIVGARRIERKFNTN